MSNLFDTPDNLNSRLKDLIDIRTKVVQMRLAQKQYFKSRGKDVLIRAKKLEKELDDLLEAYNKTYI